MSHVCTYVCMYMFKEREDSDEAGLEVMTCGRRKNRK